MSLDFEILCHAVSEDITTAPDSGLLNSENSETKKLISQGHIFTKSYIVNKYLT